VGHEAALKEVVFELANPALTSSLTPDRATELLEDLAMQGRTFGGLPFDNPPGEHSAAPC